MLSLHPCRVPIKASHSIASSDTHTVSIHSRSDRPHLGSHVVDGSENLGLLDQKEAFNKYESVVEQYPREMHYCRCGICNAKDDIKLPLSPSKYYHPFFKDFNFDQEMNNKNHYRDMIYVLRRLQPLNDTMGTLRINLPETACFVNGRPIMIVYGSKEFGLRFVKEKEKLTPFEIRKFFKERRNVNIGIKQDILAEALPSHTRPVKELPKDFNKLNDSISSIPTVSITSSKRRISFDGSILSNIHAVSRSTEAALVKYNDDSYQVLSENEVNNLLLKRGDDPIWKEIQYIQSFDVTKQSLKKLIRSFFIYDEEQNDHLYTRAKKEVCILKGEIATASEEYITPSEELHFQENLKRESLDQFFRYLLYKIFHYVEKVHDEIITRMAADFGHDDNGNIWLIAIHRLTFITKPKLKEITALTEKQKRLAKDVDPDYRQNHQRVGIIKEVFGEYYESMKDNLKVDVREERVENMFDSDEHFTILHPGSKYKLSDFLLGRVKDSEVYDMVSKKCKGYLKNLGHRREFHMETILPKIKMATKLRLTKLKPSKMQKTLKKRSNTLQVVSNNQEVAKENQENADEHLVKKVMFRRSQSTSAIPEVAFEAKGFAFTRDTYVAGQKQVVSIEDFFSMSKQKLPLLNRKSSQASTQIPSTDRKGSMEYQNSGSESQREIISSLHGSMTQRDQNLLINEEDPDAAEIITINDRKKKLAEIWSKIAKEKVANYTLSKLLGKPVKKYSVTALISMEPLDL